MRGCDVATAEAVRQIAEAIRHRARGLAAQTAYAVELLDQIEAGELMRELVFDALR